jgi:hypothetical protein
MGEATHEFKVGEQAWFARWTPRKVTIACPVCFGNRSVTVILGDGTQVIAACRYCGAGFDGPQGSTVEYEHDPIAQRVTVREVHVDEQRGGAGVERRVRYLLGDEAGWADAEDMFTDEAAALARAKARTLEVFAWEDSAERKRHRKSSALSDAIWAVGYHRREAVKCRKEAERHESRAALARARGETP